jgi:PAS domain S-box-containing protein
MSYLDKDLIFRNFNNAGVKMYGKSKEELIGQNFIDLYPHVMSSGLYQDLLRALNGQLIHQNEYYSPPTKKYFELFLVPLNNRKNEIDGVLMIAHDISIIVESKHQLEQQNLQLEQSNQELSSFSYIASHDLKEPLRKIQIFTKRILESVTFTDNIQGYFNRILSASERMQNLIDSLLNFSMANNSVLNFEPCDLNEVLEESKKYLIESIQEKHAQIVSDKLPTINGVPIQLTQLFTNLIDNSLKYSRNNIPPHICITASSITGREIKSSHANKQKEYFVLEFKDNGIGFEQQYAHKIFEIFQRLHGRNQYTGTGIGLAICKKIVTTHQGIVTAEGSPESGAIFKLYFPKELHSAT